MIEPWTTSPLIRQREEEEPENRMEMEQHKALVRKTRRKWYPRS